MDEPLGSHVLELVVADVVAETASAAASKAAEANLRTDMVASKGAE